MLAQLLRLDRVLAEMMEYGVLQCWFKKSSHHSITPPPQFPAHFRNFPSANGV